MGSLNLDATYWAEVVFDRINAVVFVVGCFKIDSRIFAWPRILIVCSVPCFLLR